MPFPRRWLLALALLLSGCLAPATPPPPTAPPPTLERADTPGVAWPGGPPRHVILIVMENKEREAVIGSADAPFLTALAASFVEAEQYHAISHPSLPNYLALLGGDTFGIQSDCTACFVDAPTLADQLEARGLTWKGYFEDLPQPCFLGTEHAGYVNRHNPFLYFHAIRDDPARCSHVVPLAQLQADLAADALPTFAWVQPNLCHSSHDCSVRQGDDWLAATVPPLLHSAAWKRGGVLIVTYDEGRTSAACCAGAHGGRVPFVAAWPGAPPGYRSRTPYSHYALLRSLEDAWSLPPLGQAGSAGAIRMDDLLPVSKQR